MGIKFKQILLKIDFIGLTPQLHILNDNKYKSIFSSILSICIFYFLLILFCILSLNI